MGDGWLKRVFGGGRGPRTVVLRDADAAKAFHVQLPMSIGGMRRVDATACKACGAALEEVLVTTHGGDAALWRERPIAVDGFRCTKCAQFLVPRLLEPAEMTQLETDAVAHAQAGRLDDAEVGFRRICNSWSRFAPARVNLAALYLARADAEEEGEARHLVIGRCLDTSEAQLRDALRGEQVPLSPTVTKLVQVLLRREATGKALEAIEEARAATDDAATGGALDELRRYVELRGDLYERGIAAVKNRVKFHDIAWSAPDDRATRRLQEGAEMLLRHQRANADSWQALFFAGKALQALGDTDGAVREMGRAFAIKADQADVAREYVMTLLQVDRAADAEPVARAACDARPTDAGLVCNLAIVQLLCGRIADAVATVERSRAMDPQDRITSALAARIREIQEGRRPAPKTLRELNRG